MEVKKNKICKFIKCKKEVHSPKAMFCGEHERIYRDKGIKLRNGLGTAGLVLLAGFVKKNIKK
ncbi:hypothetical protein [Streptococcus parasanguinis]|uniref:hypothetical protein n=1 Tax=Streptococcus parasanguinis TaxID=1318 RepID=UPI0031B5657C